MCGGPTLVQRQTVVDLCGLRVVAAQRSNELERLQRAEERNAQLRREAAENRSRMREEIEFKQQLVSVSLPTLFIR